MTIIHISAECYPVAKVGGLADVVGALPKYQNSPEVSSQVIMPFYNNKFTKEHVFSTIYSNQISLGNNLIDFNVLVLKEKTLDFDVFFIEIYIWGWFYTSMAKRPFDSNGLFSKEFHFY